MKEVNRIDFKTLNLFDFYKEYQNQKRFYLFDLLKKFNFFSEINGNSSITFDPLTKISQMLFYLPAEEYDDDLNKFLMKLILNPMVGYALSVFKYKNKTYSEDSINKIFYLNKSTINDEFNKFLIENNENRILIFDIKIIDDMLSLDYQIFNN
jgi:hypothetical protein